MTKRKLAVNDANILIDFSDIALLEKLLALDLEMYTTDFVVAEITDKDQRTAIDQLITERKLISYSHNSGEMASVIQKSLQVRRLSLEDCSVWDFAETHQAILLTGDGLLRKTALKAGLEVHGSLWLLDQMIDQQLLEEAEACKKLRELMKMNPRLPEKPCEKRLKNWCNP